MTICLASLGENINDLQLSSKDSAGFWTLGTLLMTFQNGFLILGLPVNFTENPTFSFINFILLHTSLKGLALRLLFK